jgi:putative ABC transport system permease protein
VQYATRTLAGSPGFTAVAIVTLALGIGANTAIFSVVHSVLLKRLPYAHDSDRVVRLMMNQPAAESPTGAPRRMDVGLSAGEVSELQARTRTLSDVGTVGTELMGLSGHEEGARLQGARVSSAIFRVLGARALLGRVFGPGDEAPEADAVILLGYAAWQRYFGGDPNILGRTLTLDSVLGPRRQTRYSVVGVMPQGFEFPYRRTQFWMPFHLAVLGGATVRGPMLARLADGVSMQAAAAEVGPIVREIRRHSSGIRYELVREQDEVVAPVKPALLVLTAAVGFVLLIACVNIANLTLARTAARRREIAIRAALGAGRSRLIRQALTESVLLALLGGLAGTGLALAGIRLLRMLATTFVRLDLGSSLAFPRLDEIGIDTSVLAFTAATSVVTGGLFGLAPALRHSRPDPMGALGNAAASSVEGFGVVSRFGLRSVLVVAEIAMATVLLVGGGLLIHSFVKLSSVDPGYDPVNVLTFQVSLPLDRYPDARLVTFAEDLVARLRSVPGVRAAAYANQLPMVQLQDVFQLRKTPDLPKAAPLVRSPDGRLVSRDYLKTMGIRIVAGRGFTENDGPGRPRVLLINQALARRDFDGENPVGRTVYVGRDAVPWEIAGIVGDVRQMRLERTPEPQFFALLRQWPAGPIFPLGAYYAVRTSADTPLPIATVRDIVHELDQQAALFNTAPMEQVVATTISRPRMYAVLLGIFAGIAAALAAIGIFGVMAFSVAQRTREIGIRMALGAQRSEVMALVLGQSMALTAVGIALGLAGAAAVTRYLEKMLFGLTPLDPATFVAVSLTFALVATLASYVPARRATNVDPLIALRCE